MLPPRERPFITYRKPANHYHPYEHYYGYRLKRIPHRAKMITYRDVVYYTLNGIYYTVFGKHYVVCRPPFETYVEAAIMRDIRLSRVRFHYYNILPREYAIADANYRYILRQNEIIARNNATIAAQQAQMAQFEVYGKRAETAYESARFLGLSQSYAYANSDYYYEDGVFYVIENGRYRVIVPPAGAIVDSIPEDYETVILADGQTYYKVDNTIYNLTVYMGDPCFEVMGQLY